MFRFLSRASRGRHSVAPRPPAGRHRLPKGTRITAGAAVVAAIAGITVSAALAESSASAASVAGTLTKTGRDLTTGSTSTVAGGDTAKYVLAATNDTTAPAAVTIDDTLGAGQTVTGPISAPPGYQASATSTGITASGTAVPGSTGSSVPLPAGTGTISASRSKGDGYQAIFFNGRIYNVHHHSTVEDRTIDCHVQATGAPCPRVGTGDPWPAGGLNVLATPGSPLTEAQTTLSTSSSPFTHLTSGGKLYVPAAVFGKADAGLMCIDLATEKSCGYTHVYTPTNATNTGHHVAGQNIAGGASVGDSFYLVGDVGQVFCMNLAGTPVQPCAGAWPVQVFSPAPTANDYVAAQSQVRTFDGGAHLYIARPDSALYIGCLDTATQAPCASFKPAASTDGLAGGQLLPVLDAAGKQTGVCAPRPAGDSAGRCWDVNGNVIADPYPDVATIGDTFTAQQWGRSLTGAPAVVGTKVYYTAALFVDSSDFNNQNTVPLGEKYVCHDFAAPTKTICSGFNAKFMKAPIGYDFPLRAYTLTPDPQSPSCLWEVGDLGVIDVVDARTGANAYSGGTVSACAPTKTHGDLTVTPGDFYCDGTASAHWSHYDQLTLGGLAQGATLAGTLTLSDGAGHVLNSTQVTQASFPIDLSKYSTPKLQATLDVQVSSWPAAGAYLQMTFDGDAPQVCFTVKVADNCDAALTTLTNTAVLSIDGVRADDARYEFSRYDSASTCPAPALSYAKSASVATVHPGGTVDYTISVRNVGNTAVPAASFTDDLADVLSDATLEQPGVTVSSGTAAVSGTMLTWTGSLAVGQQASITYTVRLEPDASVGAALDNTVVDSTTDVPSNCEDGSDDPHCSVTVTTEAAPDSDVEPVSDTNPNGLARIDTGLGADRDGSTSSTPAIAAGAALVLGGMGLLLALAARRRRSGT